MPTSEPPSANGNIICRRCGEIEARYTYGDNRLVPRGKVFHLDCWGVIYHGLQTIPLIYRKLRPIVPARGEADKPFVVILGEAGIGKSVTAAELLEHHAVENGVVPAWLNVPKLLLTIRSTFDDKHRGGTEEQIIKEVVRTPFLCLDDLAAEKVSDFSVSELYLILNQRGENGEQTIITSNLPLDAIAQKLDDRIASRLARYGTVIRLSKNNVQQQQIKPIGGEHFFEMELRPQRSCI